MPGLKIKDKNGHSVSKHLPWEVSALSSSSQGYPRQLRWARRDASWLLAKQGLCFAILIQVMSYMMMVKGGIMGKYEKYDLGNSNIYNRGIRWL